MKQLIVIGLLLGLGMGARATTITQKQTGGGVFVAESNTFTSSKTFTSNVLGDSSITASGFFGDGSGLTGVVAVSSFPCTVGAGPLSVVCSGFSNSASGAGATASGGLSTIASGDFSTVSGGNSNVASGFRSAVPGGSANAASGDYSFAFGQNAQADQTGCYIWNDAAFGSQNCRGVVRSYNVYSGGGAFFSVPSSTFTGGVYAASFKGDGSQLTGLPGGEANTYASSKTFTSAVLIGGQLNGSSATFTNTVIASTFNAVGSAYEMNDEVFMDHSLNATANSYTQSVSNLGNKWNDGTAISGNSQWVAGASGNGNTVFVSNLTGSPFCMYSSDAINFSSCIMPSLFQPGGVAYGNGLFVATNSRLTSTGGASATSTDGITWTPHAGASLRLISVQFGGGIFVSLNNGNVVFRSTDGITWAQQTVPIPGLFRKIAYGNGLFVLVGDVSAQSGITISTDGITWVDQINPTTNGLFAITFGGGRFVALSRAGDEIYSDDGVNWTLTPIPIKIWNSITFGRGIYVAVGSVSTIGTRIMTSPDGINWTDQFGFQRNWGSVVYSDANHTFTVAALGGSSPPRVNYSDFSRTIQSSISSSGTFTTISSVTASGFFGDGSALSNVSAVSVPQGGVNLSTVTVQFDAVGASTAALAAQFVQVGASTSALSAQFAAVGASTAALSAQFDAVGASTAALDGRLSQVAVATNTFAVKGGNSDIVSLSSLSVVSGAVTFYSSATYLSTVTAPGFSSDVDRAYTFPRTISSTGAVVVANGDTGIVVIGTSTRFNGSNSGIQYNTDVANRAQIRVNAYGNHTGVSGMTCSKSRGAFGVDASVLTGDVICRQTISAAAATAGSKPNVADASFEAAQVNALTMGVNYNLRLMNNAGTLATKFFVTSEGAGSLVQGLTVSSVTASGAVSVGGGANTVYYCSGSTAGTFDGNLARGNSNAGACAGGTWVTTSLKVD